VELDRAPPNKPLIVVRKIGRRVVLEPVDSWPEAFLACIGAWQDEIPRPKQDLVRGAKDPFA